MDEKRRNDERGSGGRTDIDCKRGDVSSPSSDAATTHEAERTAKRKGARIHFWNVLHGLVVKRQSNKERYVVYSS